MNQHDYLWNTRVTVANILHHARLVSEGWTCKRIVGSNARKRHDLKRFKR